MNKDDNNILEEMIDLICKDKGVELVLLEAMLSITIAHNMSAYEQNLLGNFFQAIGQNLCVLSIKKSKCQSNLKNTNDYEDNHHFIYFEKDSKA